MASVEPEGHAATDDGPAARAALLRLINGYQVAQAVHAAAALGLADLVRDEPKGAAELAAATGTDAPTLHRLLRALASAGVFAERAGRFGLTPRAEYLRADVPGSLRDWAAYVGRPCHWASWGQLLESVRTGEPAFPRLYGTSAWAYRAARPEEDAAFNAAMAALAAGVAAAVARSYDFAGVGVVVDVGGGAGALLAALLVAHPALRGILFDQPHVVAPAGALLAGAGVAARCAVVAGDFFAAVPAGADAYLLKSIVHDWDDAAAVAILRRCREAMADTARLLVVEPVLRPGDAPDPATFSDLNMLVMLGGRERSADDFGRLYAAAGFALTRIIPTGSGYGIIEGVPA